MGNRNSRQVPRQVPVSVSGSKTISLANRESLVETLRSYAKTQVEAKREAIVGNLRRITGGSPLVLDIGFPGAAYFSIAAGGLAEVLHVLGEDCVQVDRFSGASGGACSCFLILANQQESGRGPSRCPSSEVLLHSYLEYGASEGSNTMTRNLNGFLQTFGVSAFWDHKYRQLLQNEANWEAIRERAFCAVSARPLKKSMFKAKRPPMNDTTNRSITKQRHAFEALSDNYLFHDFSNKDQAVEAYVATGEATAKGLWSGIHVIDAEEWHAKAPPREAAFTLLSDTSSGAESLGEVTLPATFCDGGKPVAFSVLPRKTPPSSTPAAGDKSKNAFLYYHTWFDNYKSDVFFVTPESIDRLFRRGVDSAIACLSSPDLIYNNKSEKMVVVLPDADPKTVFGNLQLVGFLDGAFVSLRRSEVFETK